MYNTIIKIIFIAGIALHIFFLQINQIVKTSIGFENLNIVNNFKNLTISGLGDGTVGFLYGLLITPIDLLIKNHLLSAQITNIILLVFSGILLFNLGKKYLHPTYNTMLMILFFISPSIINYTNTINNINLYITLLLIIILLIYKLIEEVSIKSMNVKVNGMNIRVNNNIDIIKKSILLGFGLSLLFFEIDLSFIYLLSILFILIYLVLIKKTTIKALLISYFTILITFLVFISPYLYITGIKGHINNLSSIVTNTQTINKSNNNKLLVKPNTQKQNTNNTNLVQINNGGELLILSKKIKDYFALNNTFSIFLDNEKNVFTNILPNITLGNITSSYKDESFIFYNNKIFFIFSLLPILFFIFGVYILLFDKRVHLTEKRYLLPITLSLFITINLLLGLFVIGEKDLIIFMPIIIIIICFGAQNIIIFEKDIFSAMKFITLLLIFISIYTQGDLHKFTYSQFDDLKYNKLKQMGTWLKDNKKEKTTNIMEVKPIISYYSGENKTWLIPDTDKIENIISYAKLNKINYLVVDSSIFVKLRPKLKYILKDNFKNNYLEKVKEIKKIGEKVILYKIKY